MYYMYIKGAFLVLVSSKTADLVLVSGCATLPPLQYMIYTCYSRRQTSDFKIGSNSWRTRCIAKHGIHMYVVAWSSVRWEDVTCGHEGLTCCLLPFGV